LDFSRLRNGEIVAAVSGLALFIFMFFDWFGGVSAWDGLQDFSGFLIALAAVSGITLGALAAAGRRINLPFRRGIGTLVLGELAVLLILWRILANPGDLKVGIFLGLIAAAGIAIGAWIALREDGFEPLVNVPGGRTSEAPTTVASATAPAARPTPRPAAAPGGSRSGGSRSGGSSAAKTRSSGGTGKRSRSGGGKSSAKKATAKKKSTASRSKSSSGGSRSKSGGSSRSKSSGSSRSKSGGSSRSKRSASSRAKSSGTRSRTKATGSRARSKSSGTRRRSSGGRK
jgi:hypothetical protein